MVTDDLALSRGLKPPSSVIFLRHLEPSTLSPIPYNSKMVVERNSFSSYKLCAPFTVSLLDASSHR